MAKLVLRDLDQGLLDALAARAKAADQPLDDFIREQLKTVAKPAAPELFEQAAAIRARTRRPDAGEPTAADLVNEGRAAREADLSGGSADQ